ncbi:hypothetical protein ACOSP7_019059 [Xanthoceras sorbifolium]
MISNFRSTFKNLNMNGKLWNAARVGNAVGFHESMESIKEYSVDAYVWLKAEPVDKWARHCFDPRIKSDHVTNNMSECFNSWIKDERDKPILTLLEYLRRKIMVRLCEKVDLVEKMVDSITPYARNKLVDNEKYARKLQVIHGRGAWYETVNRRGKKFLVNTSDVYCYCGDWQISRLPCHHAIAVFNYKREFAHDHVHWYYSKEAMIIIYSGSINPIPDKSRWSEYENASVEPPQKRTKAGKPKKLRRRGLDEPLAPKKNFANRCRSCKALGHNSRTCPTKKTQGCTSKGKSVASKDKSTATTTENIIIWIHQEILLIIEVLNKKNILYLYMSSNNNFTCGYFKSNLTNTSQKI